MRNIAIFASGSGSNAENIVSFFKNTDVANVSLILCNNKNAYVQQRADKLNVPFTLFNKEELLNGMVLSKLKDANIDFIVLAGFLWLIPMDIINAYESRIINIHPALLPKYGGKGMYGDCVHKAVFDAKEKRSGITIHYVNERFDAGDVIFQAEVDILDNDTPTQIAEKIHTLEYNHFPQVILDTLKASFGN